MPWCRGGRSIWVATVYIYICERRIKFDKMNNFPIIKVTMSLIKSVPIYILMFLSGKGHIGDCRKGKVTDERACAVNTYIKRSFVNY